MAEKGEDWYIWQPTCLSLGSYEWVQCSNGRVPQCVIPIGLDKDGTYLYPGRAYHEGHLLPAKVKPNHGGAYVASDGLEIMKRDYEVLVSEDIAWKYTRDGKIPPQALPVGYTDSGEKLYLGRWYHDKTVTPGVVQPSRHCVFISYNLRAIPYSECEIMVLL